jgi:hypothetical protein
VRVRRTRHFAEEQANDGITEEEIVRAWTEPEFDRPSQDHPGARVRTATQPDGSKVTVVAIQRDDVLEFITTWRS